MNSDEALREHVIYLLRGGGAHPPLDTTLADWPVEMRGVKPKGQGNTAWRLLEHLRIAQWDILEFSRDPEHESPPWPEGYWPDEDAPPDEAAWDSSIALLHEDREAMAALIEDPEADLLAPLPWGDGQTLLREALLIVDHNAYHQGQLATLRRLLGLPPATMG